MKDLRILAQRLDKLFEGNRDAYGRYFLPTDGPNEQGKMKGSAMTIHKNNFEQHKQKSNKVTVDLWLEHFNGDGIGIVPIKPDCSVMFGAIDVDDYNVDRSAMVDKIRKLNLPLVACKTKSGGLHLFCFLTEPAPAELMHRKLKLMASVLGVSVGPNGRAIEIFPKQTIVYAEKNDIGHWINIPYSKNGDRWCITPDDKPRSLEEFLDFAEARRLTLDTLRNFVLEFDDDFVEAPPCIQVLTKYGVPDGSRNNFIFDMGVFLKKKYPDDWEDKLESANHKYCDPRVPMIDFQAIVKSLRKKDYQYKCKDIPICNYCNSSECRLRKYGVGGDICLPEFGTLTKIETSPPTWFLEIEFNERRYKLELCTEDLQSPLKFQKKLMEKGNIMMSIPKKGEWDSRINAILQNVNTIDVPKDASSQGQLIDYLERFCTSKAQAKTKEELLTGRPWTDAGWTYFRMSDFVEFLSRHKFNEFKQHKITSILKEEETLETAHQAFNIKGQGVNVWKVRTFAVRTETDDLPTDLTDSEMIY